MVDPQTELAMFESKIRSGAGTRDTKEEEEVVVPVNH